jgi:hypothetical protein
VPTTFTENSPAEWTQLPFLLRLMDDPSPAVRAKIESRLADFSEHCDQVWRYVDDNAIVLSALQRHTLREILARAGERRQLAARTPDAWPEWLLLSGENERLEAAFAWLSYRHWGEGGDVLLREALDDLAREYLMGGGVADPEELSTFLFGERGLQGASAEDYDNPQNSDLLSVIKGGGGLPISLASIFILVGWRLDITIHGCNFPGHFLARAPITPGEASDDDLVFDAFHNGRILPQHEVAALRLAAPVELNQPATAAAIIARVLRNMANAHFQRQETEFTREVLALLAALEKHASS